MRAVPSDPSLGETSTAECVLLGAKVLIGTYRDAASQRAEQVVLDGLANYNVHGPGWTAIPLSLISREKQRKIAERISEALGGTIGGQG